MQHSFESLDRVGGATHIGLLRPLRHRDFRRLWAGMAVSLVGDGVFVVATTWTAYTLWNAPAAMSIVGIAMTLPTVACLVFGGALSDRANRKHVLLAAEAGRGAAIAALAALAAADALTFPVLVGVVAVYALGAGFFMPAFEATVPAIIPSADLPQANALDQFVRPIAMRLGGPALGGLLVGTLGAAPAFALDAASFGASALAIAGLPPLAVPQPGDVSTLAAVRAGLRFVRSAVWLWGTLLSAAIAYLLFLGPTEVLLPYVVKNDLHGSAADLGIVLGAGGVGAVVAAAWMAQRSEPTRPIAFTYACWTLATLAVVGYGLGRNVPQLMVACLVFNALEAGGTIVWSTLKQRHVPPHLLGRVSSLDWLISISLLPVSFALCSPASAAFGARATLVGAGVVGAAVTLAALFLPGMRTLDGGGSSGMDRRAPTHA
jgi:DHA3 family tetracycline resistance protein-like MFS transporter